LSETDKKPDEHRQPLAQAEQAAEKVRARAEEPAATPFEAQLSARDELIREQARKLAQLQQELDQAQGRTTEAAQKIELLEREKAEILAVLESMNRTAGWKLVKRYRRLKDYFLPPGTVRRRLYDRLLVRLKNSSPPSTFRPNEQPAPPGDAGTLLLPPDDFYLAELVLLSAPTVLGSAQLGTATVRITNLSECGWEAASKESGWRGIVRLSYHWYDDAGKIVQWDGEPTNLPRDLGPLESATVDMRIFAPFEPGNHMLEITLVHEGIAWFNQKGTAAVRASVGVEPTEIHLQEFRSCSIVIPVHNRAAFNRSCLLAIERSVNAERLPYEVIVVDNGSTDETPGLLRSWSSSRPNARVIRMGQNLGFARACNEGARLARGHYIVFLNNDTLPTPGWLEHMVHLAEKEAQIGIVGSKLLFPNGRIQHIGMVFDENKNPRHIYRGFPADIPPAMISREYQAVTGACLLVSKDLYWSVDGMDENYKNSYEDADLCLKVRARGYRVLFCADSVLYHFESMSEGRRARDFRNSALFKARWESAIDCDAARWYALDKRQRDELTEMEAPGGYNQTQDRLLEDLWKRVYSCAFPNREFGSSSGEAVSMNG